jgi:hypothetical protein
LELGVGLKTLSGKIGLLIRDATKYEKDLDLKLAKKDHKRLNT